MDLIDRQAAIEAVLHHGEIENNYTDLYHNGYCDGVYDSADILKELPSAERKTGRWIPQDWNEKNGTSTTLVYCLPKCSVCGYSAIHTNFCPNCGAKMEGEADEH